MSWLLNTFVNETRNLEIAQSLHYLDSGDGLSYNAENVLVPFFFSSVDIFTT